MTQLQVPNLTGVAGGPSNDGRAIVIEWKTAKGATTIAIPLQDVASVIGYILTATVRASEKCKPEHLGAISEYIRQNQQVFPKVTKLALIAGLSDEHETLEIRFGHLSMQLQISTEELTRMAAVVAGRAAKAKH